MPKFGRTIPRLPIDNYEFVASQEYNFEVEGITQESVAALVAACYEAKLRGFARHDQGANSAINTASLKVGRLLEVRADTGYRTAEDVDHIFAQIGREMSKLPEGAPHIVVADWRRCPEMSPEAAEYMAQSIARSNANLLRSAALTEYSVPTSVLRFLQVIREANHPDRQLFRSTDELLQWLDEVTTLAESRRLREFLAYR